MSLFSWSFFLIMGFFYLMYRINNNKLLLTERRNRLQLYAIFCLILASTFGQIGYAQQNNFVFYFASVFTELSVYFWSAGVKIGNGTSRKLFVRPIAFAALLLTNLVELSCFWFAGRDDFWRYSMAIHTEVIKNNWLLLGLSATLVYVVGLTLYSSYEFIQDAKITSDFSLKYNWYLSSVALIFGFGFFATDLLRYVIFALSGYKEALEIGFLVRDTIVIPCYLLIFARIFADKQLYRLAKKFYDQKNLKLLLQLETLYNNANDLFPTGYRFNAYDIARSNIKTPTWALNEVLDSFSDLRHYFWQAEAIKVGEENLPITTSLEKEYKVWRASLSNPDETQELLRDNDRAVRAPKLQATSTTEKASFYIKLAKQLGAATANSTGRTFYAP
jgi:hypothetical protein